MLDTVGPEILISNKSGNSIELNADDFVTITSDLTIEPSAQVLPINYTGLAKVWQFWVSVLCKSLRIKASQLKTHHKNCCFCFLITHCSFPISISGSEERRYCFFGAISLHRKRNHIRMAWGESCIPAYSKPYCFHEGLIHWFSFLLFFAFFFFNMLLINVRFLRQMVKM